MRHVSTGYILLVATTEFLQTITQWSFGITFGWRYAVWIRYLEIAEW